MASREVRSVSESIGYVGLQASRFIVDEDCAGWSLAEFGLYCRLVFQLYESNGKLRDDPQRLAGVCRCRLEEFETLWATVAKKFSHKNGVIRHKTVTKKLAKARKRRQDARKAGLASGRKRSARSTTVPTTVPTALQPSEVKLSEVNTTPPNPPVGGVGAPPPVPPGYTPLEAEVVAHVTALRDEWKLANLTAPTIFNLTPKALEYTRNGEAQAVLGVTLEDFDAGLKRWQARGDKSMQFGFGWIVRASDEKRTRVAGQGSKTINLTPFWGEFHKLPAAEKKAMTDKHGSELAAVQAMAKET